MEFWIEVLILLATIIAIVYGPVKAVKITRILDKERSERDRKFQLLSDLMRTRQARLDPAHVGALNLIELEFYGEEKIIRAYRKYIGHLSTTIPTPKSDENRWSDKREDLFTEVLFEVANFLGYKFDKRELSRLGYIPKGLSTYHDDSLTNASLLRAILEGTRSFPITNGPASTNKFPPPPE